MANTQLPVLAPDGRPAWQWAIENNWYEASRWSPNRSWVWFPVQAATRDLDRFTRYELVKHSRYLYKNFPFVRGLIERLITLTMGVGIHPIPLTKDKEWALAKRQYYAEFCQDVAVDEIGLTMLEYQYLKCREDFLDGEGFTMLTGDQELGRDFVQGLETDRISSGNSTLDQNEVVTGQGVDGIRLNAAGRPVAYILREVKTPVPAEYIVHHFRHMRSGQKRGEPILAAGINTSRDMDDILALEKMAVKDASSHKDIIKTPSGDINPETIRKAQYGVQFPTPLSVPADPQTKTDWYRIRFAGEPIVLQTGDEYDKYTPERPGPAWTGFMNWLAYTLCLSSNMPPSILIETNIGGTDIRRDLEIAQRVVEPWQLKKVSEFRRIHDYVIEGGIENGELSPAPADYKRNRWHLPKSLSVDRGRDAQQDRLDVQAGLMSLDEYYGRYSEDADEYQLQVDSEVRKRRKMMFGTDESEPFDSTAEYVQILSLDPRLFLSAGKEEEAGKTEPPPTTTKKPAKKTNGNLNGRFQPA